MRFGIDFQSILSLTANSETQSYPQFFGFKENQDFLDYIKGKTVLDLGSGNSILAKESLLYGFDADIHSINPGLANQDFLEEDQRVSARVLSLDPKSEKFASLYGEFLNQARAADWVKLPYEDNKFDIAFSLYGLSVYYKFNRFKTNDYERSWRLITLIRAMKELERVVKPGGEIRVAPCGDTFIEDLKYAIEKKHLKQIKITKEPISRKDFIVLTKV